MHFKSWNENVSSIKMPKKILDVEKIFQYELGVFMYKLEKKVYCKLILILIFQV